jgi:serine/threonine protein phosphatase PrpC
LIKPNNSFKDKVDNFGIDPSENVFKKTLRNNQPRKEEEKFNLITNLPIKPYNNTNTNTLLSNHPVIKPSAIIGDIPRAAKKEIFSNYESANKVIFDEEAEKYLNSSNSKPTEGYGLKASSVKEYAYAENQNGRFRNYMEDFPKVVDKFMGDKTKGVFALFDGHGGDEVVKYVKDRFSDLFSFYLYNTKNNVEQALQNAFRKVDEEIGKESFSENTGCTACVAYFFQENNLIAGQQRYFQVANLGDTRAVLVSKNSCKRLTIDHKCVEPEEEKRIRNNGGILIDGRIFGQLILSRAFGDFAFKKYGVSSVPYIFKTPISDNDLFLVLASDGVWDVITESDMLVIFKDKSNLSTTKLAELIVNQAMEKGSHDNISCLLIKLN